MQTLEVAAKRGRSGGVIALGLVLLVLIILGLALLGWNAYQQLAPAVATAMDGVLPWLVAATAVALLALLLGALQLRSSLHDSAFAQAQLNDARLDALRRERELRVLLKSVQELMFRTDPAGMLTYVNERWCALHGQTQNEAHGRLLVDMVDQSDRDKLARLYAVDARAGMRSTTARMRSTDGVIHRFDIALVPLRNATGIVGFAGSAVDVTERDAAQQALQQQLAFMAQLLEINPMPVASLDASGRYLSVNRAWEEFMGLSRDQVIGKQGAQFLSSTDAALHAERDRELWLMGGPVRYEARVRHKDGTRRDVVITKLLVPGDQTHAPGLLSNMMDVSEFRAAERATRGARDAAEESSRAKSEFIANISHELRTPLQSILGFSELGIARGQEAPKLRNMFQEIHASGERMLALVNDLLDISKIESAVGAITLERADLRGLIGAVLVELRPLCDARQLRVNSELGEVSLIAKVDPVRFAQVVRNVLANAIKFSPQGADIEVDAALVADEQIRVRVRDHGVGIPPGETEAIFDAFTQSSKTKDGSGGTGLGLAICRKIMDAHSGSIRAENAVGGGAVFSVLLPRRRHLDRDTTIGDLA